MLVRVVRVKFHIFHTLQKFRENQESIEYKLGFWLITSRINISWKQFDKLIDFTFLCISLYFLQQKL